MTTQANSDPRRPATGTHICFTAARRSQITLIRSLVFLLAILVAGGPLVAAQQLSLQNSAQLLQSGDLVGAEREARVALRSPSTRAVAYAILGAIRLQQKQNREAESFLQQAIQLNPNLVGAQLDLATLQAALGHLDPAAAGFRTVLRLAPGNAEAQFGLARIENERGNYRASKELAVPIDAALLHTPDGLILLASNDLHTGTPDRLPAYLASWHTLSPPPAYAVSFAALLAENQLSSEAITVLERARAAAPADFDLNFALAGDLAHQQNWTEAADAYEQALAARPNCSACWYQRARVAEKKSDLDRALADLLKAKQLAPGDPDVLFELGRVCLERDLYVDAIANLSAAHTLQPGREAYTYGLASAYVGKKEYGTAIPLLRDLVAKHPDDAVLTYSLGAVEFLTSDLPAAERHLRRSMELNPDQTGAFYYFAQVLDQKGSEDEAVAILRPLTVRNPRDAANLTLLGNILLKQGRLPEAELALRNAIAIDPGSVKAHYKLGILLGHKGEKEASEREFATVKKLGEGARDRFEIQIAPAP